MKCNWFAIDIDSVCKFLIVNLDNIPVDNIGFSSGIKIGSRYNNRAIVNEPNP